MISRPNGIDRFRQISLALQGIPSAEMDDEINRVVDYINSQMMLTTNTSDWITSAQTPTYVDTTHFTIAGDLTDIFVANRAVQAVLGGSSVYSYVSTSVYSSGSGLTTVTLTDAVLTNQLSAVKYGVVKDKKSIPNNIDAATALLAADSPLVGGFEPTATPTANKVVVSSANGDLDGWVGVSKGVAWVGHGENVITFNPALPSGTYFPAVAILHNPARNNRSPLNNAPFSVKAKMESATRMVVSIAGGYGFSVCGYTASVQGTTERFDDVANTHAARTAATARDSVGAYSMNGYGFSSGGYVAAVSGVTERFDDCANTQTARTALTTARRYLAGYSLNGYGVTSGGYVSSVSAVTERFDDIANAHTGRLALNTARERTAGYFLNGYGFTSCGYNITPTVVGTTERFDDTANTQMARTDATARRAAAGYSFNGMGFTTGGYIASYSGITERFDDVANTHTGRTSLAAREELGGYSINGYGFSTCGTTGSNSGITERFDDVANTHTGRGAATARTRVAGMSINEFFVGYVIHA